MVLFEELQAMMLKYRFKPEKKLSQYFCINEALLQYMVNKAKLTEKDIVLEIGPGTGFLTRKLLEKSKVIAIEQDSLMYDLLEEEFKKDISEGKLTLIHEDALKEDFNKLKINKVVSLPPYHISSNLTSKIICSKVEKAILVFDRGFVSKLTAFEGLTEYGWLTAFINLNSKVEILEDNIESASFFPNPNCLSSLVEINFTEKNISNEFLIFLKEIFRQKNKDMKRALKKATPFLEKTLKIKNIDKKSEKIKTNSKKVYLHTPKELMIVFEEIQKNN